LSRVVVDACVALKWFTNEVDSRAAQAVLEGPDELHAPALLPIETDGAVLKWVRRKVVTAREALAVRELIIGSPMRIHPLAPLRDPAYALALECGAGYFDCIYLALAVGLGGTVLTADQRFYAAVRNSAFKRYVALLTNTGHA